MIVYLHLVRLILCWDDMQNPSYGRSANGAERPVLIPSLYRFPSALIGFVIARA